MAIKETRGVMAYKDEKGDLNIHYPVTEAELTTIDGESSGLQSENVQDAFGELIGQIMSGQLSTALTTSDWEIITTTGGVTILAVQDTSIDRIMERVAESVARAKADVTGGLATAILAV